MKKTLKYLNKTIEIPEDITRTIKKKLILRVVSFVLLEAVAVTVAYFFSKGSGDLASQITYFIACLIPFPVTGVPFAFFDKTYIGEIADVQVETVAQTETAMSLFSKNIVTLYIRNENGDIEVKKANEGRTKNAGIVSEYNIGDIAIHLYGTSFVVPLPDNKSKTLNKKCFICGQTSSSEAEKCYHCGHSLLDNV